MKTILFTILIVAAILFTSKTLNAQKAAKTHVAAVNSIVEKPVNMQSYELFKASVKPLVAVMGTKKLVGLGEGTHGTAEFYKVRFWITRMLVEEYGFNHIALENDYSDSWLLNRQLNTKANLDSLMKKRLLSIWQNKETREMLAWVRDYNTSHSQKITICGLDYVFANPDVEVIKQLLTGTPAAGLVDSMAIVAKSASFQDELWNGLNHPDYKPDFDALTKSSYDGYIAASKLDSEVMASQLATSVKTDCHLAIENVKQAFAPFYDATAKKPEASRDSIMAYNAGLIMQTPGTKMVIWAHDAHMGKKGVYDNEVGGTGGYLLKMFPDNYFVLATGTATGTFAATTEARDTYTNPMKAYALEAPIKGSWEELMAAGNKPVFYFMPVKFNPSNKIKPFRIIGYGPDSGPKSYDKTNLSDLFDAFLFIKHTTAATPLD